MSLELTQNEKHFHSMLHTQKELTMLIAIEANTKAKLVQIQSIITRHMEILQKELAYAENILKKDPNIFTLDVLVHLAAETTIQIKSLDVALQNSDITLRILIEVNRSFLAI